MGKKEPAEEALRAKSLEQRVQLTSSFD